MVATTTMASARNAPRPRGFRQFIPRPPPLQDRPTTLSFLHAGTAHALALGPTRKFAGPAPLPTLRFIRTFRWRSQPSRLDRPLGHDDGVAADGSGNETPGGDLGREMDEARPAHLVALLDRDRVGAVAQAASEHAGQGGGRRSRRRIFRDAHAGGEHAGMKMVAG